VKGKNKNIDVEDLFRNRLENIGIVPEASVKVNLMRKVGRREFIHFNPSRFNIYYLGGVLVAGVSAAIILTSDPSRNEVTRASLQSIDKVQVADTNNISVPLDRQSMQKSDSMKSVLTKQGFKKPVTVPKLKSSNKTIEKSLNQNKNENGRIGIVGSFTGKGLFAGGESDMNKLRGKIQLDENMIGASVKKGCTPLKVRFINKSATHDSCRWSFGDGGYSNKNSPEWIFDTAGEYNVELSVFGSDGSLITSSTVITVHPRPLARFEISQALAGQPDNEIRFINYSTNAARFRWDFGDGNSSDLFEPKHIYSKPGNTNVKLVATSEYGCSDSLIVLNASAGSIYYISFPNAFIPNPEGPTGGYYSTKSDENAQVFHPVHSGVSDYQLRIFTKLGILIFESNDIHVGWDGYFKGQLSEPGVYIWKVRGSYLNGDTFIKMGDITLLKNR